MAFDFDFFIVGNDGFQVSVAQCGKSAQDAFAGTVAVEAHRLFFGDDEVEVTEDKLQNLCRTEAALHQGRDWFQL